MTAVLDLSGGPDVGLSGWLVPLRGGIRDQSSAVRLPDRPGDVLVIGRTAKQGSRRTQQRTVLVTALLLDDDRTPPQVSGDHAEILLREVGAWCLLHNSKNAGSFINEEPPLHAINSPGLGPRLLQHGDKLRFGGGIRGSNTYSDRFCYIFEKEDAYEPGGSAPAANGALSPELRPDSSHAAASYEQTDEAERALILAELEKEKAAHPAVGQVVDAETCYEVMGLPRPTEGAPFDAEALRLVHTRLARELNPASNPSRVAAIAHKRMVEAYAVLSDAAKRSAYDASLGAPPAPVRPSWVAEKRAPSLQERRKLFDQQQRAQAPPGSPHLSSAFLTSPAEDKPRHASTGEVGQSSSRWSQPGSGGGSGGGSGSSKRVGRQDTMSLFPTRAEPTHLATPYGAAAAAGGGSIVNGSSRHDDFPVEGILAEAACAARRANAMGTAPSLPIGYEEEEEPRGRNGVGAAAVAASGGSLLQDPPPLPPALNRVPTCAQPPSPPPRRMLAPAPVPAPAPAARVAAKVGSDEINGRGNAAQRVLGGAALAEAGLRTEPERVLSEHEELMRRGHLSNTRGAYAEARAHFQAP